MSWRLFIDSRTANAALGFFVCKQSETSRTMRERVPRLRLHAPRARRRKTKHREKAEVFKGVFHFGFDSLHNGWVKISAHL